MGLQFHSDISAGDNTIHDLHDPALPQDAATKAYVDASSAAGDARYTHVQSVLAAVWTVVHGLGKYPSVSVTDAAGSLVQAAVEYLDEDTLQVMFWNSATGVVYCN